MHDDPYYRRIKDKAAPGLFKIPQVRAVGLGPKFVGGRPVGKLAIRVYVESKLPQSSLKAEEMIPEWIDDVPTDVLVWSRIASIQGPITVDHCRAGVIESATAIPPGPAPTDMELTSTAHGLFDNAVVRVTDGSSQIPYRVTVKDPDVFVVPIFENGRDKRPVEIPYVANSARWINVSNFDNLCCCPSGPIEFIGITPGKVSIGSNAHGLLKGDRVKVSKARLPLESPIYKIERDDNDNFTLVGANPSDFGGNHTDWRWHKVSMAAAGPVTGVNRGNPVVITAPGHGLARNDKVVIITNDGVTIANLDNLIRRDIAPYAIEPLSADTFSLTGVNATGWGPPSDDFAGAWVRVIDDRKNYGRKWGGIRVEVKESETETVLSSRANPREVTVHVETKLSTGTLGCIAIDNLTGKKVLLSNAHVLFSGTEDDAVHHPTFWESSRSCSNNIIAKRIRKVHGEDDVHHFTLDAAIAKFDPDEGKYDPFIVDIGPVKGVATIDINEITNADYRVWKRGAQTGLTEGIVTDIDFGFTSREDGRVYRHQLAIEPVSGVFRGIVNIQGDSGSVVVNKDNRVVGLIHSATANGGAVANPIDEVELGLKIKIWTEADLVTAGEEPIDPTKQTSEPVLPDLFVNTVAELSATEAGSNLAVIVNSHVAEVMQLLESNWKFAAIWHHNYGPEIMKHLRRAIAARNEPMPSFVQGRSLREIGTNLLEALKSFGSPELAGHAERYQHLALQLLNLTYEDLLEFLQQNPRLVAKT